MKRLSMLMAALAVVVALVVPATAPAASSKNLVQTAQGAGQFTTLVSLVKKAGLAKTLSGKTKYTVFAPTDAAFAKVPKKTLAALGKNKAALQQVLLYHVVKGSVPASTVVKLRSAKTVEGSRVTIRVRKGSVYLNGTTKVVKTNVRASNGIIHVINKVLIPKDLKL
jgi:uncharacterized surface protein with fasciclin (FAS1) repeats